MSIRALMLFYVLWMALAPGLANAGKEAPLTMEEFTVPSGDTGIGLYVRNKHPQAMKKVQGERIVLFVHGATWPAECSFDLKLNGYSWMDYVARRGFDVYLVDVRGYGKSSRPPEMGRPAAEGEPVVRTATAAADVGAVVDFILKRRGAHQLSLIGWSWGTSIMGVYTVGHSDKVRRLVQYAPQWVRNTATAAELATKLPAYRSVARDTVVKRWLNGVPEDKKDALIPAGWTEIFLDSMFASDPEGGAQTPPVVRAPNGILQDNREFWTVGKALYDPGDIRVPTLVVHGEWDADLPSNLASAYFAKLVNAPYRRYVEFSEATHFMLMEKNRLQLFQAVQGFLEEEVGPEQ
jgi:pimeloyl-ACP methyl ester carboxylesterase